MGAFELRPYQKEAVDKASEILKRYNLVYIAAEIRVGKTPISLMTAINAGWKKICFVTVKGAISGIHTFSKTLPVKIDVINYESLHKVMDQYDGWIIDECHTLGAYPKVNKRTKQLKELIQKKPVILLSGTPHAESPSQIFHQFWVSYYSPFSIFKNFYGFAKEYCKIKKKYFNGFQFNDYSEADEKKIKEVTKHYTITLSQQEAGFVSHVQEEIIYVDIDKRIYQLMDILKKNKVYKTKNGDDLVADTPVKMQNMFHQLSSGTIIGENKMHVFDESKAYFIKSKFAGQKIAIYYKFIAEGEILRRIFPLWTDSPEVFNTNNNVTFIRQVVSGRMGINLSSADALVMYTIDFSATTYFQVKGRMQEQGRTKASKIYWIFSKDGIEKYIYDAVCRKKNFTLQYFQKVYGIK